MSREQGTNNKGKALRNAALLCFAAIAVSCLICACFLAMDGGDGTFSITINGGRSRTALPWDPLTGIDDLVFTITLTGGTG